MSLRIIAVGRLKEKGFRMLADEYLKRLQRYDKTEETELNDLPEPPGGSAAAERQVRHSEGQAILSRIRPGDHVIALTIEGPMLDSPGLAEKLERLQTAGKSSLVFVIGGSLGLSEAVLSRADEQLSMSRMTFPHQLARVMLLEQLYRAMKIRAGERYHK